MVLVPVKPTTIYKVRYWDPRPNGNQLAPELRDGLFNLHTDMEVYFGVRRQISGGDNTPLFWPRSAVAWDKAIRDPGRRLYYVYDDIGVITAIGEVARSYQPSLGDRNSVRIYVAPFARKRNIGTTMAGIIAQVELDDAYRREVNSTLVFDAYDPYHFNDKVAVEWLIKNNYSECDGVWIHNV